MLRDFVGTCASMGVYLMGTSHGCATQNRPQRDQASPSKLVPKLVPLRDMGPLFATSCRGDMKGPSLVPPHDSSYTVLLYYNSSYNSL